MTTTYIQFAEKQDFETIKSVIEKEFENVKTHKKMSELDYISFDYKGESIYCHFMKHNRIYAKDNVVTECSSFGSDRPNAIKTEAFKIIAKYFNCRFWENDCDEKDILDFEPQKSETDIEIDKLNEMFISSKSKVMATYKFPNGNVATFGYNNQQIPMLQGVYSKELEDKIKKFSDEKTIFNGF